MVFNCEGGKRDRCSAHNVLVEQAINIERRLPIKRRRSNAVVKVSTHCLDVFESCGYREDNKREMNKYKLF